MKIIFKQIGLERFELRRISIDLIMHYKIVNGLVSIPFESFFDFNLQQSTHGHSLKLFYPDSPVGILSVRATVLPGDILDVQILYELPTSRLLTVMN